MNPDQGTPSALIPAQAADLARAGASSLIARGRADLLKREGAEFWLRKGLELRESAASASEELISTMVPKYVEQLATGERPETAAMSLGMTFKDQETAQTIQFCLPNAFANIAQVESDDQQALVQKRNALLAEAFQCFEKGHDHDSTCPELVYWLAESYYWGEGVPRDEQKSTDLFRRSAEMGYTKAQIKMGDAYRQSGFTYFPKDAAEAAKCYEEAAELGEKEALGRLCLMLLRHEIGEKRLHAAVARLLRKAVARGDGAAQHNQRIMFEQFGDPYGENDDTVA
jgi:TPR repeat protein